MELKKFQKLIEAINTYYAFALLLYAAILFFTRNSQFLIWLAMIVTPMLTAWTGYLLKSFLTDRHTRFGFKLISDKATYEVGTNDKYTLRYVTKMKAVTDHLMVYPVGHRWTGAGAESVPQVYLEGQKVLGQIKRISDKEGNAKIIPYSPSSSAGGDWSYWFVALDPPAQKGDTVDVTYSQVFIDKKRQAKPRLNYYVRTPMKKLELNVKFPLHGLPQEVSGCYFKPTDHRRPYKSAEVQYDPVKQWATWTISNPKSGYCYRIYWR